MSGRRRCSKCRGSAYRPSSGSDEDRNAEAPEAKGLKTARRSIMGRNVILEECVSHVKEILGSDIENITVERTVLGLFFTGVKLSDGNGGLCFTPIKEIPEAVCCPSSAAAMPLSGKLAGKPVTAYLEYAFSDNALKKAMGIAALNALTESCRKRGAFSDYEITVNRDAFDDVTVTSWEKAVVIGALVPMIRKLLDAEADFRILEMDSATLKPREMPYYLHGSRFMEVVPDSDLLVITGVTMLNDTLPDILAAAKPGARILVTGPTASMAPDPFFDHGVTMIGGITVTHPDELLDIISEGGSGYHFFGKYAERTVIRRKTQV